jgi:hypothetical protein
MLLGFMCTKPKIRMAILSLGFLGITTWMYLTLYTEDGFNLQNGGYVEALVTSLDQEAGGDAEESSGMSGIVGLLRDSLAESGVSLVLPSESDSGAAEKSDKLHLIEQLRINYEKDLEQRRVSEPWNGSAFQVMSWHYGKSLGRYFNNQDEIVPLVKNLNLAINVVFAGLIGAMLLLIFGARKNSGILYWLLVLVPLALPLFFVIDYAAWLWWYGHTLNDMGAFTVKPFMPTVFGQGKVAQFATHSYPSIGFGLMMVLSVVLAIAALIRKNQFKSQ